MVKMTVTSKEQLAAAIRSLKSYECGAWKEKEAKGPMIEIIWQRLSGITTFRFYPCAPRVLGLREPLYERFAKKAAALPKKCCD